MRFELVNATLCRTLWRVLATFSEEQGWRNFRKAERPPDSWMSCRLTEQEFPLVARDEITEVT
jgi:hypothetical protein